MGYSCFDHLYIYRTAPPSSYFAGRWWWWQVEWNTIRSGWWTLERFWDWGFLVPVNLFSSVHWRGNQNIIMGSFFLDSKRPHIYTCKKIESLCDMYIYMYYIYIYIHKYIHIYIYDLQPTPASLGWQCLPCCSSSSCRFKPDAAVGFPVSDWDQSI